MGQSCEINGKGDKPASTSNVKWILTFIPFRKPPAQWRLIVVTTWIGNCLLARGMPLMVAMREGSICFCSKLLLGDYCGHYNVAISPTNNPATHRRRQ